MIVVEPAFLVGAGGMIGAVLRHLVSEAIETETFPTGTLTVNVVGSFILGLVTFLGVGSETVLFVGTGACGAFTTFSSFSYETVRLCEIGHRNMSIGYALGNIVGALAAVGFAWLVVEALPV